MDFDSPDVAKEFPGLYMGDAGKTLNDPADFEEDEKSKKKKDKKEKEKGYATLAGESSHDEDDVDTKSPGKGLKIKAFKLSAKKKDKKSIDKPDKVKKSEKDRKLSIDIEDKKGEKHVFEKTTEIKKILTGEKEKEKKSAEKEKKKEEKKKKLSLDGTKGSLGTSSPSNATEKEKEKGLNLSQAVNAFLNAPAPLLLKKEKEKKDKDGSKVKLKLKRSKNSLEDSQSSQSDLPFTVTHQFPEDPEAITKEIKKYEALLEQTHLHIKSSKKVSKKSEEQLWELQRTLTQLKRKLRSVNALSVSSPATVPSYPPADSQPKKIEAASVTQKEEIVKEEQVGVDKPDGVPPSCASKPAPPEDEMTFDFTLKTVSFPPQPLPNSPPSVPSVETPPISNPTSPLKQEVDLNPQVVPVPENSLSPYNVQSEEASPNSNLESITPEAEVQRVQVEVQVHHLAPGQDHSPAMSDKSGMDDVAPTVVQLDAGVIKALTFSDDEVEHDGDDDDDAEEITDVSSLSLRQTNAENENSFLDDGVDLNSDRAQDVSVMEIDPFEMPVFETEEYLAIENEALIFFNEDLHEQIQKEEGEIDELMKQLEQMGLSGIDIDAPEIDLDLDQFEFDELVSLWQITKLENEALNEQVNHLRQMVAVSKLEEFRLETRLKYLDEKVKSGRNCVVVPTALENDSYVE